MEQYKEGTVFSLYEDDGEDYIILKSTEINGEIYLIACPVSGEKENLKMDTGRMVILNVDKQTAAVTFVKDEKIIGDVIDKIYK